MATKKASQSSRASWSINKGNKRKLDRAMAKMRTAVNDLDLGLKTLDKLLDGPVEFIHLIQVGSPQGLKAKPKRGARK